MRSHVPPPLFDAAALPDNVVEEHRRRVLVPGAQFLAVTGHELGSVGVLRQGGQLFLDDRVMPPGFGAQMRPGAMPPHWVRGLFSGRVETIEIDRPVGVVLNPHLVWGHFLLEMVARIHSMARLRTLGRPMPIAVPTDIPDWAHGFIGVYFSRDEIIAYHSQTQRVRAPCFVMPGIMMSNYHLHPEMNTVVEDVLRRVLGSGPTPVDLPRRLYLSRGRQPGTHFISNEAEVAATLTDLGFATIHPQELSLREQLALYSGAECIVAQFCSAAHNALFAPPGTPVFCFGWMNALQSRIAALRGQPLAYMRPSDRDLIYPTDDKRPPIYSFRIDCAALRRTLPEFLAFAAALRGTPMGPPLRGEGGVLLHIENEGDVWCRASAWNGRPDSANRIEGFALHPSDPYVAAHIAYRAMLADGSETAWLPAGAFCGTRGRHLAVLGLAARVGGPEAARYCCAYRVAERGGAQSAPAADGAWCRTQGPGGIVAFALSVERAAG